MSDPAAQAFQPRLLQAQTAGSSTATTGSGSGNSDPARPGLSQQQRASQKKAQVRAFPRAKKLEKLGVFSACKVANKTSEALLTIIGVYKKKKKKPVNYRATWGKIITDINVCLSTLKAS